MSTPFCLAALASALAKHGRPGIFNTGQGSQFPSAAFTGALRAAGIKVCMDGRGRWMDNDIIERPWQTAGAFRRWLPDANGGVARRTGKHPNCDDGQCMRLTHIPLLAIPSSFA